jgi:hypothetical protein
MTTYDPGDQAERRRVRQNRVSFVEATIIRRPRTYFGDMPPDYY